MTSRYLREAYLTSERIDAVSVEAAEFFVRLLLVVDDYGRYFSHSALVASKAYPRRPKADRVPALLDELESAKLIFRYDVAGKGYLQIEQWTNRVRSASKFPDASGVFQQANPTGSDQLPGIGPQLSDTCPTTADSCPPTADSCPTTARKRRPITITITNTNKTICGGRIAFDPTADGNAFGGWLGITPADIIDWERAYPAVAVRTELAGMAEWVKANPANRKSQWRRFIVSWLARSQDRAPRVVAPTLPGGKKRAIAS